jgi:hypothetical protein
MSVLKRALLGPEVLYYTMNLDLQNVLTSWTRINKQEKFLLF